MSEKYTRELTEDEKQELKEIEKELSKHPTEDIITSLVVIREMLILMENELDKREKEV